MVIKKPKIQKEDLKKYRPYLDGQVEELKEMLLLKNQIRSRIEEVHPGLYRVRMTSRLWGKDITVCVRDWDIVSAIQQGKAIFLNRFRKARSRQIQVRRRHRIAIPAMWSEEALENIH